VLATSVIEAVERWRATYCNSARSSRGWKQVSGSHKGKVLPCLRFARGVSLHSMNVRDRRTSGPRAVFQIFSSWTGCDGLGEIAAHARLELVLSPGTTHLKRYGRRHPAKTKVERTHTKQGPGRVRSPISAGGMLGSNDQTTA